MMQQEIKQFVESLCYYGGETKEFAENFVESLQADGEILQEFISYMQTGNFACQVKVHGYSVVDILIWQMDHFRATMDRDNTGTKQNGDRMVLLAFDTFMKMKKDPAKYLERLQGETGTDFVIHK